VTRFGEFSPIGQLLTLGSYFKNTKVAIILGLLFYRGKSDVLILTKMVWAILWALFHKLIWSPCAGSKRNAFRKRSLWREVCAALRNDHFLSTEKKHPNV
jgi:hypothetical protein